MRFLRLFAMLAAMGSSPAFAGDLAVQVSRVASEKGQVGYALHADAVAFPMGQTPLQVSAPANLAGVTSSVEAVPPGAYAVSHDLNGNRKADANSLGIPTEAWGVSNNVRPGLRAPRFDEARFNLPAERASIAVRIAR